jgi:hypothetical protein
VATAPAARLGPNPGSGPRPHDPRQRLITAQVRRRPSLPATGRPHSHPSDPTTQTAARTDIDRSGRPRSHSSPPLSRSLRRLCARAPPSNRSPVPPPTGGNRQIPIDARPDPAGSFSGGFRTPALSASRTATIRRHPKPFTNPEVGCAYSIISSARARRDAGISIPSNFAVLRLMVSKNLVGCSGHWKFAG